MTTLQICGIILCVVGFCLLFRSIQSEYALLLRIGCTVMITVVALSSAYPAVAYLSEVSAKSEFADYLPTLLKALGIAFTVQITADICRDAGEGAIAERVELLGKFEILAISLPLVSTLFGLMQTVSGSV